MALSQHIPNEILFNVLSRVSRADLLATSLVSPSFHTISQSLLYKQPYLTLNVDDEYDNATHLDSYGEFPMGSVARLLRTLLLAPRRETLAAYVRTLIVDVDVVRESTPPSPGIEMLMAAALNCGFDDQHLTDQGAQIGLLLHLLPRLTFLELRVGDPPGAVCYGHFHDSLRCPETLPIGLRNIHGFKSISTYPPNGITPTILVALLDLPSIRTITVSMIDDPMETESFVDAMAAAAGTSPVTELNLRYLETSITSLAGILKIPKALTSFSYSTEGPFWEHDVVSFGQALVPLQHSLQRLNIDFAKMPCFNCYRSPFDPYPTDRYPSIGSLRGWETLHTLQLPLVVLLGEHWEPPRPVSLADLLPLGLCSLVLYDDWCWFGVELVDQVIGILERGQLAVLRELTLVGTYEILAAEVKERLERACRKVDVLLVVEENLMWEGMWEGAM